MKNPEDSYLSLLKEGYEEIPETSEEKERFEIPNVKGHVQGNKTIIINFYNIAQTLRRKPEHLCKFLLKELATPGDLAKNGIIIGSKVPASRINEKIEKYAEEYVFCKECGKPDTKLMREGKYLFLKCQACGARQSVKLSK